MLYHMITVLAVLTFTKNYVSEAKSVAKTAFRVEDVASTIRGRGNSFNDHFKPFDESKIPFYVLDTPTNSSNSTNDNSSNLTYCELSYFSSKNCNEDKKVLVEGILMNQCISIPNKNGTYSSSMYSLVDMCGLYNNTNSTDHISLYSFDDFYWNNISNSTGNSTNTTIDCENTLMFMKSTYSDDMCMDFLFNSSFTISSDCQAPNDEGAYGRGVQATCTNISSFDDYYSDGYFSLNYDSSDKTCESDAVSYVWIASAKCLGGLSVGCNESGVTFTFYDEANCCDSVDTATDVMRQLSMCDNYDDDFLSSYSYFDYNGAYKNESCVSSGELDCSGKGGDDDYEQGDDAGDDKSKDDDQSGGAEGGSDNKGCFSEFDTVTMRDGAHKYISQVQVGEEVLVMNSEGEYVYSEVVYVPHAKNNHRASFVRLVTESGLSMSGTVGHLMVANDCGLLEVGDLMSIESIVVNQCVLTVGGAERVVSVESFEGRGYYTLVAGNVNGKLLVGGVVASSFSYNHMLANSYYHLHRLLYSVSPDIVKSAVMSSYNVLMEELASSSSL